VRVSCAGGWGWGGTINAFNILVSKVKGRGHLEYLGVGESVVVKWVVKKFDTRGWSGLTRLTTGKVGGLFRRRNKHFSCPKCGEFCR
jgi:hypothetical protein